MPVQNDNPLFIFGCAWRCGSTLLQRLITSAQEAFIWGENNGLINFLLEGYEKINKWNGIVENQMQDYKENGNNSWIANLNPDVSTCYPAAAKQFLDAYYKESTKELGFQRWGFKEVRYDYDVVLFLRKCFEMPKFLFLLRNPADLLASNAATDWYGNSGGAKGVIDLWCKNTQSMLGKESSQDLMILKYEDLINDPVNKLKNVAEFCSIPYEKIDLTILGKKIRSCANEPVLGDNEINELRRQDVRQLSEQFGYNLDAEKKFNK